MVDEHPLRRRWIPANEAALSDAFEHGIFEERNWCDIKREIGGTKHATVDLAKDLASMGVDGGTIIVGLDETAPGGDPLHPVRLRGLAERVEQIAHTRVRPPLLIESVEVPSAVDRDMGYLVVHVPASASAPHQVEGVYYGRGDKTNRRLGDPEVERLFERRKSWSSDAMSSLQELITFRNSPKEVNLPQLYIVAQPVAAKSDTLRSIVGVREWARELEELRVALANDSELNGHLARHFEPTGRGWTPIVPTLRESVKIPTGGRLSSGRLTVWRDVEISNDFDVSENGSIWFTVGTIPAPAQEFNGVTYTAVRIDLLVVSVVELLAAVKVLSARVEYIAPWSLALALTNLHDTRTIRSQPLGRVFGAGLKRGYEAAHYSYTTRADIAEIERAPAAVVERLIGAYLRGNEDDDYLDALLSIDRPVYGSEL